MNKESTKSDTSPTLAEKFVDQLYSLDIGFVDENGKALEVPESGFLGLLTTGYKGTVMLRKARGQTIYTRNSPKGKRW